MLRRLIKKLDHPNNTIYIHIDAKSPFSLDDEKLLVNSCKFSKVIMVDRYYVNWGGYSQINGEMRIFEFASKGKHDYYHLLSGVDFPIKSMKYIHDFFDKNAGFEFVHFCSEEFNKNQKHRYKFYHFFQERCVRNKNSVYSVIEKGLLAIQKLLKVNRSKKYKNIEFKCGSNWVSVTHDFLTYLLSQQEQIKKMFSYSFCADEVFLQTIIYNSPFKNKIFSISDNESNFSNMRSVDWARGDSKIGTPYTYNVNDYEELVKSQNLFCRKITDSTPEGNALIKKLEKL